MRSAVMWVVRIVARVLRYLSWGALLIPLALLLMALYGAHLWTVGVVAAALVLAVARPGVAGALLPAGLASTGICGLVVAATDGRGTTVVHRESQRRLGKLIFHGQKILVYFSGKGISASSVPGQRLQWTRNALAASRSHNSSWVIYMESGPKGAWTYYSGPVGKPPPVLAVGPGGERVFFDSAYAHFLNSTFVPASWWVRDLLIPVSLLLLIAGLWLATRVLGQIREPVTRLVPHLLTRLRQNYWGVLLVPVTAFGLSVLGVHAATIGAVVAAAVLALAWPAVAADLIPAALAGFAAYGYLITVAWQSLPPGGHRAAQLYGPVLVHSQGTALVAAAEASVLLVLAGWLVPRTVGAHVRAVTGPPAPDAVLAGRVRRLTETREHAIDAANSELRRIERDLHDGAQARLVALGMNLRAVQRLLPGQPDAALTLVGEAQETSLRALTELRSLIRGIYPPVLADRGLAEAVRALALDTSLPTELDIDLPGRLAAPVETACYFAVAETLANAVRHAGAREIHVRIGHDGSMLRIEVADDGMGGADPAAGTGLSGIERRLGTFDGILAVSSPPGGPTMIVMEVPCRLTTPVPGHR